jgi:D-proline reductase (dithiol) PrdB
MCHRSGGLILNALEGSGLTTVGMTLKPEITLSVGAPRTVYVRFPLGNPFGEPHRPDQQTTILTHALQALSVIPRPGLILELPFRWRRF